MHHLHDLVIFESVLEPRINIIYLWRHPDTLINSRNFRDRVLKHVVFANLMFVEIRHF